MRVEALMWKPVTVGLGGLWLLAAPFVVPRGTDQVYNYWLVGFVVTTAALVMSDRRVWELPLATGLGIWLFLSGFMAFLRTGTALVRNDVAIGLLLVAAATSAALHVSREPIEWRQME